MAETLATFPDGMARPSARASDVAVAAGVVIDVLGGARAMDAYAERTVGLMFAPPQSPAWVRAWTETVNPDLVAGFLRHHGRTLLALALEIVSIGPFKVARFPGGSHANGNFAPVDRAEPPLAADLEALIAAIGRARPDIDLVLMERLCPERDGIANPLVSLPHSPSVNIGLAINLDGGFEGVLARVSGKRKRKRHRSQQRKFEAVGAIGCGRAETAAEASALLDAFFAMKGERLKQIGVDDVFADGKVRAFFRRLFSEAAETNAPAFVIDRLMVGGVVRAITGSSACGGRLICEFSAFSDDELTQASPGDYLFHENIAAACAEGRAVYDFSVGDERYKREWCDIETAYADVRMPLGFKGAALAGYIGLRAALVRRIKSDRRLWTLLRRLRRKDPPQATSQEE